MMDETNGSTATAAAAASPATTGENKVEDSGASTIKIKGSYGSNNFDAVIPPQSTFGISSTPPTSATEIDSSSELYLHPSDNHGISLTSEKLNGENYNQWIRAVEFSLIARNKIGYVKGTCVKPSYPDSHASAWDRCDKTVISWILQSLEPAIRKSVLYCKTSAEVWNELSQRYAQSNKPRLYQIQKELFAINQSNDSVTAYFTKLKTTWDEYLALITIPSCSCGAGSGFHALLQEQQVMHFLMGLTEVYKTVRGSILMMEPMPNLNQAYRIVLQEEKQREIDTGGTLSSDSVAFSSNYSRETNVGNQRSNFLPHCHNFLIGRGAGFRSSRRTKFFCTYCKIPGHTEDRCYKLHGKPQADLKGIDKGKKVIAHVQSGFDNTNVFGGGAVKTSLDDSVPSMDVSPELMDQLVTLFCKFASDEKGDNENPANLKKVIAKSIGLEPEEQTLLFRGKEKDDHEHLHMAGVKDNAKVIVMENSASRDKDLGKVEEVKENIEEISRGSEAVSPIREENDLLAEQVASLDIVVSSGSQVSDKDFVFLTEMLMRQLLKLDGIDAEGEGRIQRKLEVHRVQGLVESLDDLRTRNSNPSSNVLETPPTEPSTPSSTKVTQESEVFECI